MQLHLNSLLAELGLVSGSFTIIAGVILVFVVFLLLYMIFSRYTKVGPNQVLIVSGKKHTAGRRLDGWLSHRQRRWHVRHADF